MECVVYIGKLAAFPPYFPYKRNPFFPTTSAST